MLKALIYIQRIAAVVLGGIGLVLFFSEVDVMSSIWDQIKLILSGVCLMALSVGWIALTNLEEDLLNSFKI